MLLVRNLDSYALNQKFGEIFSAHLAVGATSTFFANGSWRRQRPFNFFCETVGPSHRDLCNSVHAAISMVDTT
jgi:hypothetical protein